MSCLDLGYEAGFVLPTPRTADRTYVLGGHEREISVRDRSACRALEPTALRVETPPEHLRPDGPQLSWAVVSGEERLCCASPLPAVEELVVGAAGRHLQLLSCVQDDCDCIGTIVRFDAWYSLGERSGSELVRAGSHEVMVSL